MNRFTRFIKGVWDSAVTQTLAALLIAAIVVIGQTYSGISIIGAKLGAQGAAGDVYGPSSSVNGQLVLFSGATGKLLMAFTGTGMYKFVSGVLTPITGNPTDCIYVNGNSGPCGTGGGGSVTAGDGIQVVGSTVSVDPSVPEIIVVGSQSVTFGTITSGTESVQNLTVPGAAVGDFVTVVPPATITTGLYMTAFVSNTDTLTIRLFKGTAGNADVTSQTFSYKLERSRN